MLIYMVFVDIPMVLRIPPMKHVVEGFPIGDTGAAVKTIDIAVGTENPDPYTNPTNVRNGSLITAITCQIDFDATLVSTVGFDWYVWFNIAGAQAVVNPAGGVNISKTKNQIFHQDGGIQDTIADTAAAITNVGIMKWRLTINIPKSYQQINFGDKIQFVYYSTVGGGANNLKYRFIYKEIYP